MKNEKELLLRILDVREKMQFAQDCNEVGTSIQLLGALLQEYETLLRLRCEELFDGEPVQVKKGA